MYYLLKNSTLSYLNIILIYKYYRFYHKSYFQEFKNNTRENIINYYIFSDNTVSLNWNFPKKSLINGKFVLNHSHYHKFYINILTCKFYTIFLRKITRKNCRKCKAIKFYYQTKSSNVNLLKYDLHYINVVL